MQSIEARDDDVEPDYRYTLANERTFLAWNRTALALIAGGLAVVHLLEDVDVPGGRRLLGIPLIVLGGVLAALSYGRWERNEQAMRSQRPLPRSALPRLLAAAVVVGAVVALLVALGDRT